MSYSKDYKVIMEHFKTKEQLELTFVQIKL